MDFYKKIIKSKKLRFKILSALRFIPDEPMVKLQYRIKCGRKLNLKNPQRYTEKLQWYKLYYRDPLMAQCADKYRVREYVQSKGLGHILNELHAVFETPEDICFDDLPDRFVLKLSNGSGTNLICKDKSQLDLAAVQQQFRDFLRQSGASAGREWVYHTGEKPVILAERYLEDPEQKNGGLRDYKFLCFAGKPEYILCITGRYTANPRHVYYDTGWNKQQVQAEGSSCEGNDEKPEKLDQMLEIAGILSEGFPAARIDLYCIKGKIYFGEVTFFDGSGYERYTPDSFDYKWGKKFVLPKANHNI